MEEIYQCRAFISLCLRSCYSIGGQEAGPALLGASMGSRHGHRHEPTEEV